MRIYVWDNVRNDYVYTDYVNADGDVEMKPAKWPSEESARYWIEQAISEGARKGRYEVWVEEF